MTVIIILALIAALALAICIYAYNECFYSSPKRRNAVFALPGSEQYARVQDKSQALMDEMRALSYEEVFISAHDGTQLAAKYYHVRDGAPLQIQFHGYRGSSIRDFCGGNKLARECGHNTLVIDQRAHGKSGGRAITFGILERQDCLSWTKYAVGRFGSDVPVFLSGVSMGAATVLMAAELNLPENVAGIIADCPYSSPEAIIRKVCRDRKLPSTLLFPLIRLSGRLFGSFDICAAGAVDAVRRAQVPILILHGEDDLFVPCEMSREIKAANSERIRLETFPGAGHGLSYVVDSERYSGIVRDFAELCLRNR